MKKILLGDNDLNHFSAPPYHLSYEFSCAHAQESQDDKSEAIIEYWKQGHRLYSRMTNDFLQSVRIAKDWSGLSREQISEAAGIDLRHLDRVMNGTVHRTETLLRVLLAMRLPPVVITHLLQISPCPWSLSEETYAIYNQVIYSMEGCDIDEITKQLKKAGYSL